MAKKKEMDKLAYENHLALAAGMSYGKWKAMQDPVKIEKKPGPFKIQTRICAYCGCEYVPTNNRNRAYCGARCRKLRNAEMAAEKYRQNKLQKDNP